MKKGSDNLPGAAFGGRHDGRMLSVPGCGSVFRGDSSERNRKNPRNT